MPQNLESTASAPETAPVKTRGDRLFDRSVYAGLNGVGTFILTIPLAYWGDHKIHKASGQTHFERGSKWLETNLKLGEHTSEKIMKTTTLGLGGTLMVLPVFVAEHYHKPIVEWFNKHYGSEKDKQATVENPAPQTFASLLKGRVVAWTAVFTGFKIAGAVAGESLDKFETSVGKKTAELFKKPTHDPVLLDQILAKEGELTAKNMVKAETKAFSYGKLGALDIFATTAATSILYVSSRIFAKRRAEHKRAAGETAFAPAVVAIQTSDMPTSAPEAVTGDVPSKTVSGEKLYPGVVTQGTQQAVQL